MDDNKTDGIAATAARWHARLAAPDCAPGEQQAFEEWLAADPAHERAWRRTQRFMALARALPAELIESQAARPAPAPVRSGARWRTSLRLAACVAGLAMLGWFAAGGRPMTPERPAEVMANTTLSGERLLLADGSTLYLDAGSRVRVEVTDKKRQLEVLSGRALFEVVHDPSRPFTVHAGGSRTVALGTVFQVDVTGSRVQVMLASGSVRVSAGSWQQQLQPGTELSWPGAREYPTLRTVDATRATAWTQGRHNFQDAPLREVVQELNRYDSTQLVLGDDRLGSLVVGGSFLAGDNASVAAALEGVLPVRAEIHGEERIVLRAR